MTHPTHVVVMVPFDCKSCDGTGIVKHSFYRNAKGQSVCERCHGNKFAQHAVTLEEFAALLAALPKTSEGGAG